MVKSLPEEQLDAVFGALADPTRRAIAIQLTRGPASTSDLAAPFAISLPAVDKHLRVLERAGVVESRKAGRVRTFELVPGRLDGAAVWLEEQTRFWRAQFRALHRFLEDEPT